MFPKVCWQYPTMFCLYTSRKFSRPLFEFSLKVKVMGLKPGYFKIFSTLLFEPALFNLNLRNFRPYYWKYLLKSPLVKAKYSDTKGQIISKWFWVSSISSKKRMKEFYFTTIIPQVDLFSFVLWRNSKTPKNHFEIIWPFRR